MTDRSPGEVLAEARRGLGLTQAKLAETLKVSTVLISKIERGARPPTEAFLEKLGSLLPEKAEVTVGAIREAMGSPVQPNAGKSGGLKIVEAVKLWRKNAERANRLRARAEQLKREADDVARQLDEKVRQFDRDVLDPFAELMSHVIDLPEGVIAPADIPVSPGNEEFADSLRGAQLRTSKGLYSLLGAGVIGSGAGATVGTGAATATYFAVAGLATGLTGAAISGLSGAAATSATLPGIGGGGLAAGGLAIAGGTVALTGLVAGPVIALAGGLAILASGGRTLEKQETNEREIQKAEIEFESNEAIARRFINRAGRISEILTVALLATRNHRRTIDDALPDQGRLEWSKVSQDTQAIVRRMAEIILACLNVLALPIGMNLRQSAPEDVLDADVVDEDSLPQIAPELEAGPELENEFIDYVIDQSFAQVAR